MSPAEFWEDFYREARAEEVSAKIAGRSVKDSRIDFEYAILLVRAFRERGEEILLVDSSQSFLIKAVRLGCGLGFLRRLEKLYSKQDRYALTNKGRHFLLDPSAPSEYTML